MNESEIWLHVKSGGLYMILCDTALLEANMSEVIIYKSLWDGSIWVRPSSEFHDGRFRNINVDEVSLQSIVTED